MPCTWNYGDRAGSPEIVLRQFANLWWAIPLQSFWNGAAWRIGRLKWSENVQAYSGNPFQSWRSASHPYKAVWGQASSHAVHQAFALKPTLKPPEVLEVVRQVTDRASPAEKDRCVVEHIKTLSQPVCRHEVHQNHWPLKHYFVNNDLSLMLSNREDDIVVASYSAYQ